MYLTRDIRLKTKDDSGLSFVYHNLANLHLKTGDLDSSLYYIEESYKLKVAAGNIFAQAQDMQVYADIFMRKGFWDKAARYLETALFLTKNYANIEFESDLTEDLGYCYREMGDYKKSSDYYARHIVLKDSIEKLVSMEQLESGLIEYELISDSLQRNQLILQKDLQVAKNENDELSNKILRRNIILLIVSSAFVLAFLIFFLLRYRRRLKTTSEKHLKLARTSVPKEEKEILLKEVHHRVKNNFQIINSLIRIQSEFMNESNFQEKLKDLENRIQSMSLIHEKLYKTEKISKLNVREYLTELAENIQDSYEVSTDLTFDLNVQQVEYGIDSLIPLGLIMNETISNAIKHAFKGIANPKITVFLENESDKTKLIIQDNGVGSVKTLEQLKDESLGMELILDLTEQLDGKVKLTTTSGFIYKFEFPRLK